MVGEGQNIEVLISAEALAERIAEMGAELTRDYAGKDLAIVAVLKGSFVFLADLVRAIDTDCTVDFLATSSYGNETESTGIVRLALDLTASIEGRDVLLVEDIVDTGLTMKYLLENLSTRHPASLRVCTLLHKPSRTQVEVPIDYKGFTIDDRFVIGFGLDFSQKLRNLPYIGHKVG
ncbi:MAG: hypoxanthine phosphoribosyltransferase [Deltaproteobacteria bacterium]|nr:hypoxanthine phosphoribosyltransferase [Deltaproteobacteria bacterium]MCB9786997.1 hypoxanthine phosphoribosyltransferase [Deltaproteobacteria bacterium]